MTRFFLNLYHRAAGHRVLLKGALLLVVLLATAGAGRIQWQEDIMVFLPADRQDARLNTAYRHIASDNRLIINISQTNTAVLNPDLLAEAADDLTARLQQGEAAAGLLRIRNIIDTEETRRVAGFVLEHLPWYLDEADYDRMAESLDREVMMERLESVKQLLVSPAGTALRPVLLQDPLGWGTPLLTELESFKLNDAFRLYDDHIFTQDLHRAVLILDCRYPASETARNASMLKAIDEAAAACVEAMDGQVQVVPFGAAVIAQGNANRIKQDSLWSMLLAAVLIAALMLYYFKHAGYLVLVLLPVAFGFLTALGLIGLCAPQFSVIALGIGAVMLGIAVNYPLHFLSHRSAGHSIPDSLQDITEPLTTGNITTIGAFLSLLAVNAPAMHHFGLFAAFGLLGTILCVLIWLPHWSRRLPESSRSPFAFITDWHPEQQRGVWIVLILGTLLLWHGSRQVEINPDMQQINYMTDTQRTMMQDMLQQVQGARHLTYFVTQGDNLETALQHYEAVMENWNDSTAVPSGIGRSIGIGRMLPSQDMQARRTAQWEAFWRTRLETFGTDFAGCCREAGFKPESFDRFLTWVAAPPDPMAPEECTELYEGLASEYIRQDSTSTWIFTCMDTSPETAEEAEVWLNSLSPHTFAFDAGTFTRQLVRTLSDDLDRVLLLCGGLVFGCLWAAFGCLELALTAFLPLCAAWIWILGIMHLIGMEFNIVTLMLATFIFGMGDDYTIFMLEGMMYERTYKRRMMRTYRSTVILSALIMLAGIGVLILAKHPAMQQLARCTFIGMTAVVLMAYVLPTSIFRHLTFKHGKERRVPLTLRNAGITAFAFVVFCLGALYLNLAGFRLLTLHRRTERRRLQFHRKLCNVARFIVRHVPFAPASMPQDDSRLFDRPAVITANHQSHLDLMAVLALHPRILVVTNQWAWHSPFYGTIIRYADFCPIDDVLQHMDKLRDWAGRGWSIMMFPEGTRTADGHVGRFHQGAFLLAQQLDLPVRPLLLHGFYDVLPKTDLLMRPGRLTVRWLPEVRVPAGTCYRDTARSVRSMYQKALAETASAVTDAAWFIPQVSDRYVYKPAAVVRTVRRFLRAGRGSCRMLDTIPAVPRLLVVDQVYGAGAIWTALRHAGTQVDAYLPDAGMYDVAVHCSWLPDNLHFLQEMPPCGVCGLEVRCTPGRPISVSETMQSHV